MTAARRIRIRLSQFPTRVAVCRSRRRLLALQIVVVVVCVAKPTLVFFIIVISLKEKQFNRYQAIIDRHIHGQHQVAFDRHRRAWSASQTYFRRSPSISID